MDTPHFTYGEVVKVLDDIAVVHQLQKGHGEWDDEMALVRHSCTSQTYILYVCMILAKTVDPLDVVCVIGSLTSIVDYKAI